jgi:hypothetical protein
MATIISDLQEQLNTVRGELQEAEADLHTLQTRVRETVGLMTLVANHHMDSGSSAWIPLCMWIEKLGYTPPYRDATPIPSKSEPEVEPSPEAGSW